MSKKTKLLEDENTRAKERHDVLTQNMGAIDTEVDSLGLTLAQES
jgi:hypothetical protein